MLFACHKKQTDETLHQKLVSFQKQLSMLNKSSLKQTDLNFKQTKLSKSVNVNKANPIKPPKDTIFAKAPFQTIEVLGILLSHQKQWALISNSEGTITKVQKNNRIGKESAKIIHIGFSNLELSQNHRKTILSLSDKNTIKQFSTVNAHDFISNNNIALNFYEISTRAALKWLAAFIDKNIVISKAVHGHFSLTLRNVSWQQVMNVILQSQELAEKNIGNILYIAPKLELAAKVKNNQILQKPEIMQVKLIHLNYAKAKDIAKILAHKGQSLLSKNGFVSVDSRTNSLVIKEDKKQLITIAHFVKKLDIVVPQVLIEAHIVNVDNNYEKELGVKFGITNGHHISGTLKGANEIASGKSGIIC